MRVCIYDVDTTLTIVHHLRRSMPRATTRFQVYIAPDATITWLHSSGSVVLRRAVSKAQA